MNKERYRTEGDPYQHQVFDGDNLLSTEEVISRLNALQIALDTLTKKPVVFTKASSMGKSEVMFDKTYSLKDHMDRKVEKIVKHATTLQHFTFRHGCKIIGQK